MCVEKDFKLILLQYKLGDIILKEALEQVMDIYEKDKEVVCDECEENKKEGTHFFVCDDCIDETGLNIYFEK